MVGALDLGDHGVGRVMLGCWLDEPVEAGLIARRGAIQMARVQVGADRFARRSRHPQTSAHRDAQAPLDRSGGPDTVAESVLSGYRKADGYIHWHYWLLIGPRRHVFDPTAHQEQFKREGPMKLDHYVIEGHPLPKWRRAVPIGPDPGV